MKPGQPPRGFVTLRFPDGTELAGDDFTDVLRRLGTVQWSPCDADKMKRLLSDRAWAWSETAIDPLLPDADFIAMCVVAQLFIVLTKPERAS